MISSSRSLGCDCDGIDDGADEIKMVIKYKTKTGQREKGAAKKQKKE